MPANRDAIDTRRCIVAREGISTQTGFFEVMIALTVDVVELILRSARYDRCQNRNALGGIGDFPGRAKDGYVFTIRIGFGAEVGITTGTLIVAGATATRGTGLVVTRAWTTPATVVDVAMGRRLAAITSVATAVAVAIGVATIAGVTTLTAAT